MAETDSIYLTINLADSTANLEISGVVVHKAKMSSLKSAEFSVRGMRYHYFNNVVLSVNILSVILQQ